MYYNNNDHLTFMVNNEFSMILNADGYLGVGMGFSADSRLHVADGDSMGTVHSTAEVMIEDDDDVAINLLSPAANSGSILFGDSSDNDAGALTYDHSDDEMSFSVAGQLEMFLDSNGINAAALRAPDSSGVSLMSSTGDLGVWVGDDGQVGIGTNTVFSHPSLHVKSGSSGASNSISAADVVVEDDGIAGVSLLSGTAADCRIYFGDSTDINNGTILYNALSGVMEFTVDDDRRMRIDSDGVVSLWASELEPSAASDKAFIYAWDNSGSSSTVEMKVMDSAGNDTVISPHNFELYTPSADDPLPWSYHSTNKFIGKKINVDMSGAIRALEALTGQTFIHTEDLPESKKIDPGEWRAAESARLTREAKFRAIEEDPWVEVTVEEATHQVELTVRVEQTQPKLRYVLNTATRQVEEQWREEIVLVEVPTGEYRYELKPDCRLDPDTGKCYRRRTLADVAVASQTVNARIGAVTKDEGLGIEPITVDLPQWVKDRVQ